MIIRLNCFCNKLFDLVMEVIHSALVVTSLVFLKINIFIQLRAVLYKVTAVKTFRKQVLIFSQGVQHTAHKYSE